MNPYMIPGFIALATALDVIHRWYRRHDRNVWEGADFSPLPVIAWGWILEGRPKRAVPNDLPRLGHLDSRYFILRLPVYEFGPIYWEDECGLLQRVLFWTERGGWRLTSTRVIA